MLTLIRYLCAAAVGYTTAQLLLTAGIPLDTYAQDLVNAWLGTSQPSLAEFDLLVVGPIFAVFAIGIESYWQPLNRICRKLIGPGSSRRIQISHDTWLQDAVFYITHGRWLNEDEEALTTEEQSTRAAQATSQICKLAEKSRLTIWGKMTAYEEHQKIPLAYWNDHQIDTFHLLGADRPEEICTERITAAASWDRYHALKVSKSEIEAQWPPKNV